jgi:hypothetical protein
LQSPGHIVELIGQRFDLVACLDRNSLAEVTDTEARSARIGTTMRLARNIPAAKASASAPRSRIAVRSMAA